jgi:Kef-type K+ transport system membrane component KefB
VLGFDWLAAILLASMFASHTLLAYPIVSRLGLSSNQAVTTTLGGTMITDTAALLVLAVIAGMASGEVNEAFWWRLAVSLVVFIASILLGLPRLGRWFFRRVADDGPAEFVFVLTSVFLCAALSHAAGLEPIVGAFLAGLALNRLIPHQSPLMNRLTFTGEAIFIPFFLLSVGMLLDARVLFGGLKTWVVAICMTLTVIATKSLAADATRIVFRYRKEEGRVMFGLSVVQAAATLAAVMVGHRIGLFDDAVVNGTIVMILVTCILGPAVVSKFAPAMVKSAAEQGVQEPAAARGVLLPLVSAEHAESAVELALLIRHDKSDPIYPTFIAADDADVARKMADADKVLARAVSQASAANCIAEPIKRVHNYPGRALIRTRKELHAKYVLVPWDGLPTRGYSDLAKLSDAGATDPPPAGAGQQHPRPRMGRVIDALATDSGANLLLCRLPHPLGTCSRTVLFVPPRVVADETLSEAAALFRQLAKALGTPLLLMCHDDDRVRLDSVLGPASDVRRELASYSNSRGWLPLMMEHVREHDLLILYGVREPEPAFSIEYQDFSQRVFARYPLNDLMIFYPASIAREAPTNVDVAVPDDVGLETLAPTRAFAN